MTLVPINRKWLNKIHIHPYHGILHRYLQSLESYSRYDLKKKKKKQLSNSSCNVILFFPQKNVIFVCIAVGASMVLLALDKL